MLCFRLRLCCKVEPSIVLLTQAVKAVLASVAHFAARSSRVEKSSYRFFPNVLLWILRDVWKVMGKSFHYVRKRGDIKSWLFFLPPQSLIYHTFQVWKGKLLRDMWTNIHSPFRTDDLRILISGLYIWKRPNSGTLCLFQAVVEQWRRTWFGGEVAGRRKTCLLFSSGEQQQARQGLSTPFIYLSFFPCLSKGFNIHNKSNNITVKI